MTEQTTEQQKPTATWRDKTLKVAGYGYSVGDLSMAAAAKLRDKNADVFGSALIWLAGGLAAARYGHPAPHTQLEIFSHKLDQHLRAQGVQIPDDVRAQNALLQKPGFLKQCETFLYQHPSELLNAAYAIGAGLLLKSGFKELKGAEAKNLLPKFHGDFSKQGLIKAANGISKDFWMGTLVGGGALSGLLIKEDPEARAKAAHGSAFEKAAAYIKEKPLRLTGTLYGANNIFTVLKALEDHSLYGKQKGLLKPHYFSGTTAATYILANVLLTTVSRDQAESKKFAPGEVLNLEDAAARVIASQPADRQKELLTDVANFVAQQKGIEQKAPEIAQALTDRIAALTKKRLQPAVDQSKWTAREEAREATPAEQAR